MSVNNNNLNKNLYGDCTPHSAAKERRKKASTGSKGPVTISAETVEKLLSSSNTHKNPTKTYTYTAATEALDNTAAINALDTSAKAQEDAQKRRQQHQIVFLPAIPE